MGRASKGGQNKFFNRAYTKAALIRPVKLSKKEDLELRRYLYAKPFGTVPCQICGRETLDRDSEGRSKIRQNHVARGVRVCGPCLFGKPPGW